MQDNIKELLVQSVTAHYNYMRRRIKNKDIVGFEEAKVQILQLIENNYFLVPKRTNRGYNLFVEIYYEIYNNITERYINGTSRDFIFDKL